MTYAIVGFGEVGQALATMFARRGMDVSVAATRSPDALASAASKIGSTVHPVTLEEASKADIVLLAVPFKAVSEVAGATDWSGRTIVDVTNAYGVPVEDLDGKPSSSVVAEAFTGAKLVKAFNHLAAPVLAQDPEVKGGRRVIFVSSDDDAATGPVVKLVEQLGFAPVKLGKLAEGGSLVQARGKSWTQLIFQDFVKFD